MVKTKVNRTAITDHLGFRFFAAIGRFAVRFRWLVIIFWIAAVPLAVHYFPNISSVEKNTTSEFLPPNTPTSRGKQMESAFQQKDTATSAVIVISRQSGQLIGADNQVVGRITDNVKKVHGVTEVKDLGASADGQARELLVGLNGDAFGMKATTIVDNIRTEIKQSDVPSNLRANLTGDLAAQVDQENANNRSRNQVEGYTVVLIIVLLLLVFRAALAPLATLVPAVMALLIAQPVIAEATKIGVQVGFITQIMLIVLILGAGTDYGLFLVFRTREELRAGLTPKEAVIKAVSRVGESISFSAATVIAALLALLFTSFGLYKGLGPALAIGLGIMLLMALTFLPALLSILGRAVFWPSKTAKRELKIGLWGRLADRAIKRPAVMLALGALLFGGLSLGLLGYRSAGFGSTSAPSGTDSAAGQTVLARHFPAADSNPELLIAHFPDPVWNNLNKIKALQDKLNSSGSFSAISGPFNANGNRLTVGQLASLHQQGNGSVLRAVNQFISSDGRTVQFYAVLSAGPSGSASAMRAIPAARAEFHGVASRLGADADSVYGSSSVAYDINQTTNSDLKKIIPIVLLVIGALLALMLRSLVAPWYLIITVGLSYLASLGFAMIVFVHLAHQEGINFVLPFLLFVFAMALGEDYNILVINRIREEAHHEKSLFEAITKAIGITGTTVTSAGLILAGTFSIFGIVGGNAQGQQIGFGVAFAILLDTFFVRTLLVPSIVAMLGRWNWWPSKLSTG